MNRNANVTETVEQAIQPADEAARAAARAGSRVRARLEHRLHAAKASLHNGRERVRTTARHAAENTDEYVHSNPWSAIGIAAVAGAAIAVLLSTRMHR